jgi:phospholipase/carboxylesterase
MRVNDNMEKQPLHQLERAPKSAPSTGTLVLLHGYGAHEGDLIALAEALDPGLHAVGLRAGLALPWGGYAWYPLVPRGAGLDFNEDEVGAAVAQAAESIEAIAKRDGQAPLLLGFSQGGGIALSLCLQRPELCRAVFALSAVPPAVPLARRAPREKLKQVPVFAAHGTRDELLPILLGRQTRATMEESGCLLEWHEYPMGHEVGYEELQDARAFLARL